jgi:cell division septation protein DedD
MALRFAGVLLLAAGLAGCAEFADTIGLNGRAERPQYAMAAPEPVMAPEPQTTGSLPPPAQNITPPPGKFGVQIAAHRSVEEARAMIDTMRAKYPSELGQQWATILPVSLPKGMFYRVVIGPLASEQQASQLCSKLKAQGEECFIRHT